MRLAFFYFLIKAKDQLGLPSANTEQRSKPGLHYMTATGNSIALLVWAHPLIGLWIKLSITIARMMLRCCGQSPGSVKQVVGFYFPVLNSALYYDISGESHRPAVETRPTLRLHQHWKSHCRTASDIAVTRPVQSNPDTCYLMDGAYFVKKKKKICKAEDENDVRPWRTNYKLEWITACCVRPSSH